MNADAQAGVTARDDEISADQGQGEYFGNCQGKILQKKSNR